MSKRPAPLYTDSFALCVWVLGHFGGAADVLGRHLAESALALHRALVLALKQPDPEPWLLAADEQLITLRAELRLAEATGRLDEAQLLYALTRADDIGRQLGGWLRALPPG